MSEPTPSSGDKPQVSQQVPVQQPLPLAFVNGEAVLEKPQDLYIPPEALEVILETFEGPLDLLLYLIKRQKLDIANMPIVDITRQYMEYVDVMKDLKLELAGEYLLMAAILAEIKSRVLLPRPKSVEEDEEDPRAELIRRLKEYEAIKQAAAEIDGLPRQERDNFTGAATAHENCQPEQILPEVDLKELVLAFQSAMQKAANFEHHHITPEVLSTRERMSQILDKVQADRYLNFSELFTPEEGRSGVVVSFLAVLELVKESLVELLQSEAYSQIHIRAAGGQDKSYEELG
ncbi:Segregation and condensation protein [Saliniradius amylolyticus]|uniref:Segregation and condensation protein A n=1 Tax=Saliniradius amylolyticus TaxID=2183582 RepID=A0A2S2E246_9ALTE|nr:ScpA family protein [Saliniradius amylolyticus]AWL11725.1 Segregation and condensation protein [Saliniradius amylolyticus]